jgi:hypothetical protein
MQCAFLLSLSIILPVKTAKYNDSSLFLIFCTHFERVSLPSNRKEKARLLAAGRPFSQ